MQEYAMELSVPMTRFKVNDRVRYTEQAARGMMNLGNQNNAVIPWDARVGTIAKVSSLSSSRVYVVWDGRKTQDQIEDRFLVGV
jgi:hypothetical protein